MILHYPSEFQVGAYSTFELIRAKVLLPEPSTEYERRVLDLVEERLGETDPEHRAIVELAIGYGPG